MRKLFVGVVLLFVGVGPAWAQERVKEVPGKVLYEAWYESKTDQGKIGHLHFVAREVDVDGMRLIRSTVREETLYLRSGDPYQDAQEQETLETPSGQVVEISYGVTLSKTQKLKLVGKPNGNTLTFHIADSSLPYFQTIPWDPRAVGLYAMEVLYHGKKVTPGEATTVVAFNPVANRVFPTTLTVKGKEKVPLNGMETELTRVEQTYPKEAYLTKGTMWLDDAGRVVRMQDDDSTLFGPLVREIASRDDATAPFKAKVTDKDAPVLADKPIVLRRNRPNELLLRISMEGEDEPGTLFPQDGRQQVVKADKEAVELRLLSKTPAVEGPPAQADAEYLESNFFIRSDDPLVRKLTLDAVGSEKNTRAKLARIKRWMGKSVHGCYEVAFATADEVARTLEGDCSEMGVLAAAMCRVIGVPSRVAFGLVYDPEHQGFGGHLWCEVYLDGHWETFDTTDVVDRLHAAYLRVGSYSMKNVLNPDEMNEVRRAFAGQMRVEVLEQK